MTSVPADSAVRITDERYHAAREQVIAEFERAYVTELLDRAEHNLSEAARIAGVDRTTVHRLMQRLGLARMYAVPETPEPIAFATEADDAR